MRSSGRVWLPNTGYLCTLALVASLLTGGTMAVPGAAAEPTTVVAIGESNDEAERAELLDLFGAGDSAPIIDITVDETFQAWAGIFDLTGVDSAYSSVALTCNASQSGIDVTTSNIEVIPPELYALALVTAGLTDAKLVVAAPADAPALGMTALTGVFQAWDRSSCAGSEQDPARRQLALQQLALVAQIGEAHGGAGAVGLATDLVLSLQQAVVTGQTNADGLDAMVTARADQFGFPLTPDEQASIVDFFDLMLNDQPDWAGFADSWRVDHVADGTRVLMRPGASHDPSPTARIVATGVGGQLGPIPTAPPASPVSAPASVTSAPTMTPRVVTIPSPTMTATPAAAMGAAGPTDTGGSSAGGSDDRPFPWWMALLLIPLGLGLLLLARRRRRSPLIARHVSPVTAAAAVAERRAAAGIPAGGPSVPGPGGVQSRKWIGRGPSSRAPTEHRTGFTPRRRPHDLGRLTLRRPGRWAVSMAALLARTAPPRRSIASAQEPSGGSSPTGWVDVVSDWMFRGTDRSTGSIGERHSRSQSPSPTASVPEGERVVRPGSGGRASTDRFWMDPVAQPADGVIHGTIGTRPVTRRTPRPGRGGHRARPRSHAARRGAGRDARRRHAGSGWPGHRRQHRSSPGHPGPGRRGGHGRRLRAAGRVQHPDHRRQRDGRPGRRRRDYRLGRHGERHAGRRRGVARRRRTTARPSLAMASRTRRSRSATRQRSRAAA